MRAFTLSANGQISFKQDLYLMKARRWHRAVVKSANTVCDRAVVQQEDPLRRDGWQPKLTIVWAESVGLS